MRPRLPCYRQRGEQGWVNTEAEQSAIRQLALELLQGKRPLPISPFQPNPAGAKFPPPPSIKSPSFAEDVSGLEVSPSTCPASWCPWEFDLKTQRQVQFATHHRRVIFETGTGYQSTIRMSVAWKVVPGAWVAVPKHEAVVGVDLPASFISTLSVPKMEGGPCLCRLTAMVAENFSPS